MSSLNQAFIKAYGKDAAPPSDTATPAVTNPPGNALGNWYSSETWFRAEAPQPVPAPHVSFPPAASYEAPTTADLNQLAVRKRGEEVEYRLSPPEPAGAPELVIDEEEQAIAHAPAPAVIAPPTIIAPPKLVTPPAPPAPVTAPTADAFALHALFAPVQIGGGWDSTYGVLPAMTTVQPVEKKAAAPVAKTPEPKAKPAEAKPAEAKVMEKVVEPTPAPVVKAPAPPVEVAVKTEAIKNPASATALQMRLDAANASPVPKPHVNTAPKVETPAPVITAPAAKIEVPKVEAPVAKVEAPKVKEPVATGPMQAAWEVDRFQWPDHCKQLLSPENQYLSDVGQRLASASKDGLSILAVTSTRRGEGRTTLALCLAKAAAAAGVKVALVDADGDNPQLVNELGVEASCGWHDVVLNKEPLSEAAILSIEDRFTFFPWTTSNAIKSLNDPQVTRVLKKMALEFQLVILDLGPAPGRETKLFEDGEHCPIDAAILVRDVRWTSAIEAQRVASQLLAAGVGSVGIAENFGPRTSQAA
ncbi:MAG TPA: cellulose synthase operon protein YhjQ/BcsQ [Pirellulaceae bacterium]|nr:cellulose synthase operon protein YhjQ/BcsQ [Pirellulaceae bacterium]